MSDANVFTLILNEAERAELLRVLHDHLADTHAENRRTENPRYRGELREEEGVLRTLEEKVRRLTQ